VKVIEQHPGSVDTYKTLSSGADGLERYRIMEGLGQYLLNGTNGDILEIGVGESSHFLTKIAKQFNRRIYHCDASPAKILNPMSVPGYLSDTKEITYFEERDPVPTSLNRVVCYGGTSDTLFKKLDIKNLALSFIDGDHLFEQVWKDFNNVFERTVDNGYILMHDTFPPSEEWLDENHCGDAWRIRRDLEFDRRLDCLTIPHGVCIGVGLTILRKRVQKRKYFQ